MTGVSVPTSSVVPDWYWYHPNPAPKRVERCQQVVWYKAQFDAMHQRKEIRGYAPIMECPLCKGLLYIRKYDLAVGVRIPGYLNSF